MTENNCAISRVAFFFFSFFFFNKHIQRFLFSLLPLLVTPGLVRSRRRSPENISAEHEAQRATVPEYVGIDFTTKPFSSSTYIPSRGVERFAARVTNAATHTIVERELGWVDGVALAGYTQSSALTRRLSGLVSRSVRVREAARKRRLEQVGESRPSVFLRGAAG